MNSEGEHNMPARAWALAAGLPRQGHVWITLNCLVKVTFESSNLFLWKRTNCLVVIQTWPSQFGMSRMVRLNYYQTIGSFSQEQIRWNAWFTGFHCMFVRSNPSLLILFKRTVVFSGIQFTRHFIEFVFVEITKVVRSNPNVILIEADLRPALEQGCGKQIPSASILYSCIRSWYVSWISICRKESDLGLRISSVLAKRMRIHNAACWFKNVFGRKIRLTSAIAFSLHIPILSCSDLDPNFHYVLVWYWEHIPNPYGKIKC